MTKITLLRSFIILCVGLVTMAIYQLMLIMGISDLWIACVFTGIVIILCVIASKFNESGQARRH